MASGMIAGRLERGASVKSTKNKCEIESRNNGDVSFGVYRDEFGGVVFAKWVFGQGFDDWARPKTLKDIKRLRDWLTKFINHAERP